MNPIPALPLLVLADMARTHGKGNWISLQLSALHTVQSCFPGHIYAPSRRVQFQLFHTPHSVVADSPFLFKLNESSSPIFPFYTAQEARGLLGTGLVALCQTHYDPSKVFLALGTSVLDTVFQI